MYLKFLVLMYFVKIKHLDLVIFQLVLNVDFVFIACINNLGLNES